MQDNIRYFKTIPAEADGLLRFEMQLHPAKLHYLLKKVPGIGLADLLSYTQDLCRMEFERYTKTLFCSGDYYTLNVACELVRKQVPTAQAIKIVQFLKDVSVNKSLYQTIKEYQREGALLSLPAGATDSSGDQPCNPSRKVVWEGCVFRKHPQSVWVLFH